MSTTVTCQETPLWDSDFCLQVREMALLNGKEWTPRVNDGETKIEVRKATTYQLPARTVQSALYHEIMDSLIDSVPANNIWDFEVYANNDLTAGAEFIRYQPGDFYRAHTDWGSVYGNRKISVTVQLSDPDEYRGGEMLIYNAPDPGKISQTQGTATFFPSWTLHEVKPVMKGERWALVCWFCGPPYC